MRNLIIGSGPAAAGVALRLSQEPDQEITVLDIGGRLEPDRRRALDRLAGLSDGQWDKSDIDLITAQPVAEIRGQLPQKRSYGSDYPFKDMGQLVGVHASAGSNSDVISGAYGGFSNVWGAQIMPFTGSTFERWPVSFDEMRPHYELALREIPFAAEEDDLAELFPLLAPAQRMPELAPRTTQVLKRFGRHRGALGAQGITVGRARLAFQARNCVRCGMCMTGCPYSLVYSAAQTFDRLRAKGRLRYVDGMMAHRLGEDSGEPWVLARELSREEDHCFRADRIFVAAGGIGTTRLVLGSLDAPPDVVEMGESRQFVMPFVSMRPVQDPRERGDFTLNQFNMLIDFDHDGYNTSHIHFYPYNPAFLSGMPSVLSHPAVQPATRELLRRVTVGLGYVPSWASPRVEVRHRRDGKSPLPAIEVSSTTDDAAPMYRQVVRKLVAAAPKLDLWPVVTHGGLSGAAKSYHFGGSFAHGPGPTQRPSTDRLGRLPEWGRVHLVDGSVFPSVPSTTFTLTVMANAHRIASEALGAGSN
jgi:choline dehydrogenase-like flavoprotein